MAINRESIRVRREALREHAKNIKIHNEFMEFLKEYKVVGLAIAFVMGAAATTLIKSLVDNIIMQLITPFIPGGAWQTATFTLGKVVLGWGAFLGALINFIAIAFAIFLIVKIIVRKEKEEDKK